jgi:hypothetical protein
MGPAAIKAKQDLAPAGAVVSATRFFSLIENHRKLVLSTPFVLAAILTLLYIFGPSELRRVLDFMSPGHLLGR